jgi:aconitate hydratase
VAPIADARVLTVLGDSVTTDHISPAGSIPSGGPAGTWLTDHGVEISEFNSFGSRRGNHEIMMRGGFSNIRIRNLLAPGTEGGVTRRLPGEKIVSIYDAAMEYRRDGTGLVILAGKEYGTGSSRDWAAKATLLLGVRAVIAESYERIHRSNLVGMGVLPLEFSDGESVESLGLTGLETYSMEPVSEPRQRVEVRVKDPEGGERSFITVARIDTAVEMDYYLDGGILQTVLRQMAGPGASS